MTAPRHDVARTMGWTSAGTELLLDRCAGLDAAAFDEPSLLPQWSRRQVIGHLARNAEALGRLASWARTGQVNPMYADAAQRSQQIEESGRYDVGRLQRELVDTAGELAGQMAALDDLAWAAMVRSAQGRDIPAAEIPWMRAREVWLHALDLQVGLAVAELPVGFCETLIDDVLGFFARIDSPPAMRLVGAGSGRTWVLGEPGPAATVVLGREPDLAAWLTGRTDGAGLDAPALPKLPRWL